MKRLTIQFLLHKLPKVRISLESFFITLIILGIPLNLYKNRFYDNSWTVGEWLISYAGGFVRRGLPGQVIFYLSSKLNINPITIVWGVSLFSLLCLFILLIKFSWKFFYKPFLLSSVVILGPISENYLIRKDCFLILLYGLCLLVLKKINFKQIKNFSGFALVNFFSIIALLTHEGYGIWALPSILFLIFLYVETYLKNFLKSLITTLGLMIPSIISFIFCIVFKGNKDNAMVIHESWKELKNLMPSNGLLDSINPDGAIAWIGLDLDSSFQLSISTFSKFNLFIFWHPLMWAITIFFVIRLFSGFKQDPLFNLKRIFIFIQLILFIPLFIIAHDYGRWIFIWICSSCILFSYIMIIFKEKLISIEEKLKKIKIFDKLFPVIKTQRIYNTFLLFLGIPHCCWSLGRYLISNPIGFSIKNLIFYTSLLFS